jgi:eukaryotic-like serine/threonine-protein kinase
LGATQKLLRFGLFELNLDTEELRKGGIPLKLAPQPFRILALLAGHAGQIITREEIRQQIWGNETYVDFDHGLNQCIKQIRNVLADNPDHPLYVETLPRRGYRFLAPVTTKTVEAPRPNVVESHSNPLMRLPVLTPTTVPPATVSTESAAAVSLQPTTAVTSPAAPDTEAQPALQSPVGRKRLPLAWAATAALVIVAGAIYWHSQKASALAPRETIVVADFNNTTGAELFDNTLKVALTLKLEESPHLKVLSDKRIAETLKLMDRPAGERLTRAVAREVCQRNSSQAYVAGSISRPTDQYVITLTARNCETDQPLASVEEKAENQDRVLNALGQASVALRGKLGESLASVRRYNKPLEEVTTSSFEALQAFTQARRAEMTGDEDAVPYLKRALELDPNFAPAYAALASCYLNTGQDTLATENYKKAFELRDRVSVKEQFLIDGLYYAFATGQLDKAIQSYAAWIQTYPGDEIPYAILGALYDYTGQYEKAAEELRERSRLAGNPDDNLVEVYAGLNRFDEAQSVLESIRKRRGDAPYLRQLGYFMAFLQGDNAAMEQNLDWAKGRPAVESWMLSAQSDTEAYHGRIVRAREFSNRAMEGSQHESSPESAADWIANEGLREAEIGNFDRARKKAEEALALSSGKNVQAGAAVIYARIGDLPQAQKLADLLNQEFPLDTMVQGYSLPVIRAAIELNQRNPARAVEVLQAALPYELGNPSGGGVTRSLRALYPAYARGQAYLEAGQGREASMEFQKVLDHPGVVWNSVLGSLAHLQLGRAQAMLGDKAAARKTYQDFFALWKDADPDTPVLKAAKSEYQTLN